MSLICRLFGHEEATYYADGTCYRCGAPIARKSARKELSFKGTGIWSPDQPKDMSKLEPPLAPPPDISPRAGK